MRREGLSAGRLVLAGTLVAALALGGCQSTGQSVMVGAAIGAGLGGVAVAGKETAEELGTAIGSALTGQDLEPMGRRSRDDDYEYEYVLVGALVGGLFGWLIGNKRINKASGGAGGGLVLGAQEAALNMEYPTVFESLVFGNQNLSEADQAVGFAMTAASAGGQPHRGDLYDSLMRLNGRTAALAECLPVLNFRKRMTAPGSAGDWCADAHGESPVSSPAPDAESASDSPPLSISVEAFVDPLSPDTRQAELRRRGSAQS